MSKTERLAKLDAAIRSVEKAHGKGAVARLGDHRAFSLCETFPTGSILLDFALGIGGYPRGRIIELFGAESSGKSTLTLHAIASIHRQGGDALLVDAEHAFDKGYAESLGVDTERLLIAQPDYGEQALDVVKEIMDTGVISLIVVDSVAALIPKAELEGDMGDNHIGLQARLMGQALRKLTAMANRTGTTIIFTNQLRMKIGVIFGNPQTTPGGNALKFFASLRLELLRKSAIKEGSDVIGHEALIKVVKNKMAPPFSCANVGILFGRGIDPIYEACTAGIELGIIEKAGAWYSFQDIRCQGVMNFSNELAGKPELLQQVQMEIVQKLRSKMTFGKPRPVVALVEQKEANEVDSAANEEGSAANSVEPSTSKRKKGIALPRPLVEG